MSMAVSDFIFNACSFLSVFASLFLSHCARSAAVSGGGEVTAMIFFFFEEGNISRFGRDEGPVYVGC